jgi:hypothetical protein
MMFETIVDCEGGGPSLQWFIAKFCSYKSDFDLDIVQRFFKWKKNGPNFQDF